LQRIGNDAAFHELHSGKNRGCITYLSGVKPLAAEVSFSPASSWMPTIWARAKKRVADMTKVA
jgi:hypothetical protein